MILYIGMSLTPLKYFESLYPENTRESEIRKYLDFLKKGLSAQIIGLPGSGKNNLLRLLAYNVDARNYHLKTYEKLTHFVYIDSAEVKNRPHIDIVKLIFSSIAFSLAERRLSEESSRIQGLLQEAISLNDEFLMFQYLKKAVEFLTIEKKLSIILLFDRFDSVSPTITEEFFANLKALRNLAKYRFGAIFSLKRPLEDTVDVKIISDFSDIVSGNEIYISIYDPVAIDFRTKYIEKAARKTVDKKLHDEILELTGGHSKLTKLSFEKIVSEDEKMDDLKTYLLKQPSIISALDEIWQSLLPSEKLSLKNKDSYSEQDDTYLVKSGLVTKDGLSIPLLKDFIERQSIESDSLTYDSDKNEILKDGSSITQTLSSSEFKLLKFMIENKDKVISKDELINAVWTNQKTQEGVSDQAFDQIIYRVRKKVERDPANPTLIKTIKGTGYKLSI